MKITKNKYEINIGDKFGKLTVADDKPVRFGHCVRWKCYCDCDTKKVNPRYIQASDLYSGNVVSCGCHRKERSKEIKNDLTGMTFGELYVVKRYTEEDYKNVRYLCRCSCGKEIIVPQGNLHSGNSKSCGHNHKTGVGKDRLNHIWVLMKRRCSNPDDSAYKNYGGRGITVCEEWENDYHEFKKWAIENGYDSSLSIDRIDVNGNYEPSNCRWATVETQSYNKRNTVFLTGKR